jgi:hypothetical protein
MLINVFFLSLASMPLGIFLVFFLFQGGFPLLFLTLYHINETAQKNPEGKIIWKKTFSWVKDSGLRRRAFYLASLHCAFYLLLIVLITLLYVLGSMVLPDSGISIMVWALQLLFGLGFSFWFWEAPALVYKGLGAREAMRQASRGMKEHWRRFGSFLIILHLPLIPLSLGVRMCIEAVMTRTVSARDTSQDLLSFLWYNETMGVLMIFVGWGFQFTFWMIFLAQNYSPTFWKYLKNETAQAK